MGQPDGITIGGGGVVHNYYSLSDGSNETLVLFNGSATFNTGTKVSVGIGPDMIFADGSTDVKPMVELKVSQNIGNVGHVNFSGFSRFRLRCNNENSAENKIQSRVGITAKYKTGKQYTPYITLHGTNKGNTNKIGLWAGAENKKGYIEAQADRNLKTKEWSYMLNTGFYF